MPHAGVYASSQAIAASLREDRRQRYDLAAEEGDEECLRRRFVHDELEEHALDKDEHQQQYHHLEVAETRWSGVFFGKGSSSGSGSSSRVIMSSTVDEDRVVHSGFVHTYGKLGVVKQRRFFAIDESTNALLICVSDKQLTSRKTLPLAEVESVSVKGSRFTLHFARTATPPNNGRTFSAACRSPAEAADWASAIEAQRDRALRGDDAADDEEAEQEQEDEEEEDEVEVDDEEDSDADDGGDDDDDDDDDEEEELEEADEDAEAAAVAAQEQRASLSRAALNAVADLTYFEFLGGVVTSTDKFVWVGEGDAPPARRLSGSRALANLRTSLRKSLGRGGSSSSSLGKSSKAKKANAADKKKSGKKKQQQQQGPLSKRAELSQLVERNMAAKATGKGKGKEMSVILPSPRSAARAAAAQSGPAQSPRRGRGGRIGGLFKKMGSAGSGSPLADAPGVVDPADMPKAPLTKDELKEKIARQARQAGGGLYLTGAATVGLGEEIANSKITTKLAQRKAEMEERKRREAAAKAKAAKKAAKQPAKPKPTLSSFLASQAAKPEAEQAQFAEPAPEAEPPASAMRALPSALAPSTEEDDE